MVEIPDSFLTSAVILIGFVSTFIYFFITRKDKQTYETKTEVRSADEEERDKQELARKVKKELADEADKIESIRKAVAETTKTENQAYTNQKVGDSVTTMKHEFELYKQHIEGQGELHKQATESRFKASDLIMTNLLGKMVEIAKISSDSMIKIQESIDQLKEIFYELSGKVNKLDTKVEKEHQEK